MNWLKRHDTALLGLITGLAAVLFAALYGASMTPVETPPAVRTSSLEDWDVSQSDMNGAAFEEDKGIYEDNAHIYDVYLSVFPTKDAEGNLLDFSSFDLHTARDHSYNPTLNCNIQILPEGQTPDPLLDLNNKNATIRVRGNSARGASLKSYKVKMM